MKKPQPTVALQGTLELPYEQITKTAARATMRELARGGNVKNGRQTFFILFKIIKIRDGFNIPRNVGRPAGMSEEDWEKELEIEELALEMLANGHHTPLIGDLTQDGKIFWLTDGERRFRAIGWLIRNKHKTWPNGQPINMVEVMPNKAGTTDEERLLIMVSTDKKLKYKPIQLGHLLLHLKTYFNHTHDTLSVKAGISRQSVDNLIKLAQEPEAIQQAVETGALTATAATALRNSEKDPAKREEIVKEAIAKGETLSVKDATGKGANAQYFHDKLGVIVEQFNDDVLSYKGAVDQVKLVEIEIKQKIADKEVKDKLHTAILNTLEVIDNNNANKELEKADDEQEKFDDYHIAMSALITELLNDEIVIEEAKITSFNLSEEVKKVAKNKRDSIDAVLVNVHKIIFFVAAYNDGEPDDYVKPDWQKTYIEILLKYMRNETDYISAVQEIKDHSGKVMRQFPLEFASVNDEEKKAIAAAEDLRKFKHGRVETKEADKAEEKARTTSDTYQEPARKKDQKEDALAAIDFTKDRSEGEMLMAEALSTLDKIDAKLQLFPANLKQYVNDISGLLHFAKSNIDKSRVILKKAGDTR